MVTRITLYGGTNINNQVRDFVAYLVQALLKKDDVVLVSGGYDHREGFAQQLSVDKAVLLKARELLGDALHHRFETFIPADKQLDRENVQRFEAGVVHRVPGTAQARRFTLVKYIDAVVTIAGEGNTASVLELALAINKPALPVAFTGGDSSTMWHRYQPDIQTRCALPPSMEKKLTRIPATQRAMAALAAEVASYVYNAARKKCLVLMPFSEPHNSFYLNHLKPAIETAGFVAHRIDKDDGAGNIPVLFRNHLDSARAVVIDITGLNANVMYELGYAHAKGIQPFIIQRGASPAELAVDRLAFYLKQEMILSGTDDPAGLARLAQLVEQKLKGYLASY